MPGLGYTTPRTNKVAKPIMALVPDREKPAGMPDEETLAKKMAAEAGGVMAKKKERGNAHGENSKSVAAENRRLAIRLVQERGEIRVRDAADFLGLSEETAGAILRAAIKAERVTRRRESPQSPYIYSPSGSTPTGG